METWLRVVTYRVEEPATDRVLLDRLAAYDAAMEGMKSCVADVIHELETQPGFKGGYGGHNPVDGTVSAITYWSSLAAIEAATGGLHQLRAEAEALGLVVESVHHTRLFAVPETPLLAGNAAQEEPDSAPRHRMRPHLLHH